MRVLVLRPESEAKAFAAQLRARGHEAVIAPLFEVRPLPPPPDFEDRLRAAQAILLTSANGARALAAATAMRGKPAYAVGDATAAAAESVGFAEVVSAGGDAQALAALVRERLSPGDGPLLHVGGEDVAADFADLLADDGFDVGRTALYTAREVESLPAVADAALAGGALEAVAFFSPRSARHFATLVQRAGRAPCVQPLAAAAISEAALAPVASLPWRRTCVAPRPTRAALLAEIDALAPPRASQPDAVMSEADKRPPATPPSETPSAVSPSDAPVPAAEPAAQPEPLAPPPAPVAQQRRGLGAVGAAFFGLVGGAVAFAGALYSLPHWPAQVRSYFPVLTPAAPAPAAPAVDLSAALKERDAAIAGAMQRMAGLEAQVAARGSDDALRQRLQTLEAQAALQAQQARADLAAIRADVQRLASLPLPPASAGGADPSVVAEAQKAIDALKAKVEEVEKRAASNAATASEKADREAVNRQLAGLQQELEKRLAASAGAGEAANQAAVQVAGRIAALEEQVKAQLERVATDASSKSAADRRAAASARAAALLGVSARLRAQVEGGSAFAADLDLLKPLATDAPAAEAMRALQPLSGGAPTRTLLANEFHKAARAALAADLADDSVGERVLGKLKGLVSVRRTGEVAGDSVEAKLARAETALGAGALAKAVAEVESIPAPAAEAMRDWLGKARAALAAQTALDRLSLHAISLLSQAAP